MKEFILGDCMEGMKDYPDNFFDLAIVDPPYKNETEGLKAGYNSKKRANFNYSTFIAPDKDYITELTRVSKNQIIWGFNYFLELLKNTDSVIIWNKHQNGHFSECELAWSSIKKTRIFDYAFGKDLFNKIHPTQKPIQLYKWLLNNYATCKTCKSELGYYEDVAGDGGSQMWIDCDDCDGMPKILDTHVGSGSSLIAFEDFGCEYVGYEIDKEYFDSASKRLKIHKSQLNIFM